jgi:isopenicillin N synthase-like dioxygenase
MSHDFPVIDIAAMRQPQVSAVACFEIARQVASACEEIGFFAVTGHGVPGAVIADLVALDLAPDFFDDKVDRHISQLRIMHYPPRRSRPCPGNCAPERIATSA